MSKNNFFKRDAKKARTEAKISSSECNSIVRRIIHTEKSYSKKRFPNNGNHSFKRKLNDRDVKRREFKEEYIALQFCYILYQLGILDLIGKQPSRKLLCASIQTSTYNVHHIDPLGLTGTNSFYNLSLIDRKLHGFIHNYCLSKNAIDLIRMQPPEKKQEMWKQFVPALTPVARAEDFFAQSIVCAARSVVWSMPKKDLIKKQMPISSKNITESFSPRVLYTCNFDAELYNRYVGLQVSYRLAKLGKKKAGIKKEISEVETQITQTAKEKEPILADIRKRFDMTRLVHDDALHHVIACALIRRYGLQPKRVLTWDKMEGTCKRLLKWEKQRGHGRSTV